MKTAECALRLHPNTPIKRQQRDNPSQRFTVSESFAKTFWVLFRKNILQQRENTVRKSTPIVSSRIFSPPLSTFLTKLIHSFASSHNKILNLWSFCNSLPVLVHWNHSATMIGDNRHNGGQYPGSHAKKDESCSAAFSDQPYRTIFPRRRLMWQ